MAEEKTPVDITYTEKGIRVDQNNLTILPEDVKQYIPEEVFYLPTKEIIKEYVKPISYGILKKKPVLLIGETGCGKNATLDYLARMTNNGVRRVNFSRGVTEVDLFGSWTLVSENTVWLDGILTECMRKGMWFVGDEINLCLPEILLAMNSLLEDGRSLTLSQKGGELIKAHPNFRFFATMNPDYAGTLRLNQAFKNRFFPIVQMKYPDDASELDILTKRTGNTGNTDKKLLTRMVKFANKVREAKEKEEISETFSLRTLIQWVEMLEYYTPSTAFGFVLNSFPKEDIQIIRDLADGIFPEPEFRNVLELKFNSSKPRVR